MFFTSWGDGLYPVFVESSADGIPWRCGSSSGTRSAGFGQSVCSVAAESFLSRFRRFRRDRGRITYWSAIGQGNVRDPDAEVIATVLAELAGPTGRRRSGAWHRQLDRDVREFPRSTRVAGCPAGVGQLPVGGATRGQVGVDVGPAVEVDDLVPPAGPESGVVGQRLVEVEAHVRRPWPRPSASRIWAVAKPTFTHSTRSRRLRSKVPGPVEKERAWRTVSTTGHTSTHTWRASPTSAVTDHCRPSKVAQASMPTPPPPRPGRPTTDPGPSPGLARHRHLAGPRRPHHRAASGGHGGDEGVPRAGRSRQGRGRWWARR